MGCPCRTFWDRVVSGAICTILLTHLKHPSLFETGRHVIVMEWSDKRQTWLYALDVEKLLSVK